MNVDGFSLEMDVRDNEIDAQSIVNYESDMIYLSHARHKRLRC
jgi:acyl-CoA thioesterase FadM